MLDHLRSNIQIIFGDQPLFCEEQLYDQGLSHHVVYTKIDNECK
jgi:hypothetical protein